MTTDDHHHEDARSCPTSCDWCGLPLPPRSGRGRPARTHAGACRKAYRNRYTLDLRIDRFKEETRLQADPSDGEVPGAIPADFVGLDGGDEEESLRSRLERGGFAEDPGTAALHGKALAWAVEAWEKREQERKPILRYEETLAREEAEPYEVDPDARLADGRRFGDLSPDEVAEVVARRAAERRARARAPRRSE